MTPMKSNLASTTSANQITDEQIGKLFDQLRPGIQSCGIPKEDFQIMLEQERVLKIRSRFKGLLQGLHHEISKFVSITVDYSRIELISEIAGEFKLDLEICKYTECNDQPQLSEIPLVGTGNMSHEVFELWLRNFATGSVRQASDFVHEFEVRGIVLADPLTTLLYACEVFKEQRGDIESFFTASNGQFCHMLLKRKLDGSMIIRIQHAHSWCLFGGMGKFLVVRKSNQVIG